MKYTIQNNSIVKSNKTPTLAIVSSKKSMIGLTDSVGDCQPQPMGIQITADNEGRVMLWHNELGNEMKGLTLQQVCDWLNRHEDWFKKIIHSKFPRRVKAIILGAIIKNK